MWNKISEKKRKRNIMGTRLFQALVINSSNFNRFNVERIKRTKKIPKPKEMRVNERENNKIAVDKKAIILAYSVERIKE